VAEAAAVQITSLFDEVPVTDLGTISIRVFVLPPKPKKGSQKEAALPLDQALRRFSRQWPAAGISRQQLHRAGAWFQVSALTHDDCG
jgi:hypothetical protein